MMQFQVSIFAFIFASMVGSSTASQAQTIDVQTAEFRGKLYQVSAATRAAVGVVFIGGSEGELLAADTVAPQMAALGYPVLGVNYHGGFADRSRPLANVPLEQFSSAVNWLLNQPGIRRVVVIGESRGSEAALLTAINSPKVSGVIGVVPSIYVWSAVGSADLNGPSGWTLGGKPLSYVRPAQDENPNAATFTKSITADQAIETATIPIEKIRVPILLIGSSDDAVWPSGDFVNAAAARVKRLGAKVALDTRVYPDAGHRLLGKGASSPTEIYAYEGGSFTARYGGTQSGNARARADAWRAITAFLTRVEPRK